SLSWVFVILAVNTPVVMPPLIFNAVRAISIIGSIEINKPTIAIGRFNVDNTISEANVAPPPTPATPNELIATTINNMAINDGVYGVMPTVGATITASIAGYIPAQPFCPIVTLNAPATSATPSDTPNPFFCVSMFNGNAPALEREENPKIKAGIAFLIYVNGFNPANLISNI